MNFTHRSAASVNRNRSKGFTLIEVLVASVIIAVSVAGSALLVSSGTTLFRRSTGINELSQLVEADIAALRRVNDRMVCDNGTCRMFPGSGEPRRNDYFPITAPTGFCSTPDDLDQCLTTQQIQFRNFVWDPDLDQRGLCESNTPDGGFAFQVDQLLPSNATLDSRLNRVMTRSADGQLYTLTYTEAADARFLRQITLVPSIFAWCPTDVDS